VKVRALSPRTLAVTSLAAANDALSSLRTFELPLAGAGATVSTAT
jgi:hypothetical protein